MDEPLTEQFCREILGTFSFVRRLFAWDAFSCHLTPAANVILNQGKVDSVIVPGGCTKYIQAADVSWNKPMKEYLREMYDLWLAENEHELTTHGNMKPVPRQKMVEWVLEAWKKLPTEIIVKSFQVCALSSNLDGSEGNEIVCIKRRPCRSLLTKLRASDLKQEKEVDPFQTITEEDIAMEDVPYLLLSEDDVDELVDIEV